MNIDKLVVGLVGMPGAGKSVVVGVAINRGYDVVMMGDVVRAETERRGLTLTPETVGKVMLDLRPLEGASVIARKCLGKIQQAAKQNVIVDGIRSTSEVEEFRKHIRKFSQLAVHASPDTRFKRLFRRQRSDDPNSWEIFKERDARELRVGLGSAIATAEFMIVNEQDLDAVKKSAREILKRIEEKWENSPYS